MIALNTGFKLTLVSAMSLLAATAAAGAAPEPCKVLPADVWGGIMGYTVTAVPAPTEMDCTYVGKSGGGQFHIMAVAASSAAAEASAKGQNDKMKDSPEVRGGTFGVYSSGSVVFSIGWYQRAAASTATASSASQLQKLVAAAKQRLPK